MSIERIVRPFQTRNVAPPNRILPTTPETVAENVVLQLGLNGSGKTLSGSYSHRSSRYMDKRYKEKAPA